MLHSQLVTPGVFTGSITPILEYPLTRGVPVRAGQVYTIGAAYEVSPGHGGFCGTLTNPYGGGVLYNNGQPVVEADLQFRIYIAPSAGARGQRGSTRAGTPPLGRRVTSGSGSMGPS